MVRPAWSLSQTLRGLFAVYKPPGIHWKRLRDTVETKLLKELNASEQLVLQQQIRFLPSSTEDENRIETNLTVAQVPVLADHPRVKGPRFLGLKVGVGHRLDLKSSGVLETACIHPVSLGFNSARAAVGFCFFTKAGDWCNLLKGNIRKSSPSHTDRDLPPALEVLGLGNGNQQLARLYNQHLTKEYTVQGSFGTATEDFSDTGRLIEKTTWDHITLDRLERIIAVIQGVHQRALLTYSGIDLKSQEAYELASRGLLRPMHKSPPIITAIRCIHFSPPNFTLEIQCLHETQQYLRKIIHEIGLELKSSAVCTHVRRIRDGIFSVEDALIRTRWDLHNIQAAIQASRATVKAKLQENSDISVEDISTEFKGQQRRRIDCSEPIP